MIYLPLKFDVSNWTAFSVSIPSSAFGPNTQFRWRQFANSGPAYDCWSLEDLIIQGAEPSPPDAVPFVISSASSSTSIAVFWIDADRAASYVVERKVGLQPWTTVATLPQNHTYYTDAGLVPGTGYSYRIKAVSAGGAAPYSPVTTTSTWTQMEQWQYDNYGSPQALSEEEMTTSQPDGSLPLLRYAFNLSADESQHYLQPGQTHGYPRIWLDSARNRLSVEFVRRNDSMNPGITYQVQFCTGLGNWISSGALVSTVPLDAIWERVRYEDVVSRGEAASRFCRVTVRFR